MVIVTVMRFSPHYLILVNLRYRPSRQNRTAPQPLPQARSRRPQFQYFNPHLHHVIVTPTHLNARRVSVVRAIIALISGGSSHESLANDRDTMERS